jgi:hypothetical protein
VKKGAGISIPLVQRPGQSAAMYSPDDFQLLHVPANAGTGLDYAASVTVSPEIMQSDALELSIDGARTRLTEIPPKGGRRAFELFDGKYPKETASYRITANQIWSIANAKNVMLRIHKVDASDTFVLRPQDLTSIRKFAEKHVSKN